MTEKGKPETPTNGKKGRTPHDYFLPKHERKLKGLRITHETIERIESLAEKTDRTQSEIVDAAVAYFYDSLKSP